MRNMPVNRPPAEFDAYAADYNAGMENRLKKCFGQHAESFMEPKIRWILTHGRRQGIDVNALTDIRVLDYGCGAGTMLSLLRRRGFAGPLAGCDVAGEMLAEVRRRWCSGLCPDLRLIEDNHVSYADAEFDVVILSSVLHHVPVAERHSVYREVLRVLKPGGQVCVFEHNPLNPLTRYVVRHTEIDNNAILLKPAEVVASVKELGASHVQTDYIMFLPPRWTLLQPMERALHWLPLGAQYVVSIRKG